MAKTFRTILVSNREVRTLEEDEGFWVTNEKRRVLGTGVSGLFKLNDIRFSSVIHVCDDHSYRGAEPCKECIEAEHP